ncbi:hypothetical protein [Lysinibacillus xylanilyticus]|uniref:hypothetical protein n=1 Tax=Lysinibacillus xylanilyticus TaxID=582475 RepID=UPI0036DB7B1A
MKEKVIARILISSNVLGLALLILFFAIGVWKGILGVSSVGMVLLATIVVQVVVSKLKTGKHYLITFVAIISVIVGSAIVLVPSLPEQGVLLYTITIVAAAIYYNVLIHYSNFALKELAIKQVTIT